MTPLGSIGRARSYRSLDKLESKMAAAGTMMALMNGDGETIRTSHSDDNDNDNDHAGDGENDSDDECP